MSFQFHLDLDARNMVKLGCIGKAFQMLVSSAIIPSYRTLRSVNTGFALGNCIPATSDFNLTAMIEVDYSLTDWFRNEQGYRFAESDLVFWGIFDRKTDDFTLL